MGLELRWNSLSFYPAHFSTFKGLLFSYQNPKGLAWIDSIYLAIICISLQAVKSTQFLLIRSELDSSYTTLLVPAFKEEQETKK